MDKLIIDTYTQENYKNFMRKKRQRAFFMYIVIMIIGLFFWLLVFKGCAMADNIDGYTSDQWANAISHAEGNSNYGVLAHYKHTTYRQTCINTVRHAYRDWDRTKQKQAYISFLQQRYCPIGSNTDNGTCKYWKNNVNYWLERV